MLRTSRLCLRNLCGADISTMYDYRNDSNCNRYQRYEDTGMEYLRKFVQDFSRSTFLSREEEQHYAIACHTTGEMIGDLSVFFTEKDNCFTLGITVAPRFQGQGYAYELLREVIARMREQYPSVDLVALIERDNGKSIALFRKLNFVEECFAESIQSYVFVLYGKTDG